MMKGPLPSFHASAPAAVLAASLIPLLPSGVAQAAPIEWSAGTGDFSTAGNWSGGVIPTGGDTAVLGNGGTIQVTSDQTLAGLEASEGTVSYLAGQFFLNGPLRIGTGSTQQSATLDYNGPFTMATAEVSIGEAGSTGMLTFNNGFMMKTPGSSIVIAKGAGSNGSLTQISGFLQCQGGLVVASGDDASGIYDMGGTSAMVIGQTLVIGAEGGDGTLAISGSAGLTKDPGSDPSTFAAFGSGDGSTATVTVSGGRFINPSTDTRIGTSGNATATWTISGEGTENVFKDLYLGYQDSASATFNLDGGVVRANSIHSGSSGTSILNLNGGVLLPASDNSDFISGLTEVNVLPGGAIIDTTPTAGSEAASHEITIPQDLLDGGGGLTIRGPGLVVLAGTCSYSGGTLVESGGLVVTGTLGSSDVTVGDFGEIRGTGTIAGSLQASGTVWPGVNLGTLGVGGDTTITGYLTTDIIGGEAAVLATGGQLDISAATHYLFIQDEQLDQPVYVLATYGTLVGEFLDSPLVPDGYEIDYAYEGNKIALVSTAASGVYDDWAAGIAWADPGDALPDGDPDHDGVANFLEFYTGSNPLAAGSALPVGSLMEDGGSNFFRFTFKQATAAATLPPEVEYGDNLADWETAADGVDGVTMTHGPVTGGELWTVDIPTAPTGRIFARLKVTVP
ncbi:hypothetical protein [Luteolibacter marinus]|uniref:hypothetical protein n=1 Tax=Luteolibacter marinus TaxID=2776705 RepID=UPI001D03069D|nr:hypothetical protein [Luteolibacter marinus]